MILKYAASAEEESPAVTLERAELERLIASSIDRIPKVEKTVLSLYFYEELTLQGNRRSHGNPSLAGIADQIAGDSPVADGDGEALAGCEWREE